MKKNLILICDDQKKVHKKVGDLLNVENMDFESVYDGKHVLESVKDLTPDLILIDIMMSGIYGLDICKQIRKHTETPIIILTHKSDPIDKIIGLELGVDDYIEKPFSEREVVTRIKAVLRRGRQQDKAIIKYKDFELDLKNNQVYINNKIIEFTQKEIKILESFKNNIEKILSREFILCEVWGEENFTNIRAIDTHIKKLRKKLYDNDSKYKIETIYGVGYRLTENK